MALISQELDYVGINFYSRNLVSATQKIDKVPGSEYTEMGWEVCAPAMRRMLVKVNNNYKLPPVYITENGSAARHQRLFVGGFLTPSARQSPAVAAALSRCPAHQAASSASERTRPGDDKGQNRGGAQGSVKPIQRPRTLPYRHETYGRLGQPCRFLGSPD